ncbi:MAG: Flp pilus assembly protein CpaB [Janthinobacterium lividum]
MNIQRLMVALAFALVCSGLLTWQLSAHLQPKASSPHPVPVRQLVVAAKDISAGDSLNATSLTVVDWPTSQHLVGSFSNLQELSKRELLLPVPSGAPIMAYDLADSNVGSGIAALVPNGMRAMFVRGTEEQGSGSSLVAPGSHVDILVTYRSETDATFVSSLVLQDIKVLAAVNKEAAATDSKSRSDDFVTLLVTPEEAARLTVASSLGKVTLALRNGTDKALTSGLAHVSLTAAAPDPQRLPSSSSSLRQATHSERKPQTNFTVETLAGGKSTFQSFQGNQP